MSTLYVRDFPDELHRKVRKQAARKHHSMGAEVIVLVEQALEHQSAQERRLKALEDIGKSRESLPRSSDSLDLLREDRDR